MCLTALAMPVTLRTIGAAEGTASRLNVLFLMTDEHHFLRPVAGRLPVHPDAELGPDRARRGLVHQRHVRDAVLLAVPRIDHHGPVPAQAPDPDERRRPGRRAGGAAPGRVPQHGNAAAPPGLRDASPRQMAPGRGRGFRLLRTAGLRGQPGPRLWKIPRRAIAGRQVRRPSQPRQVPGTARRDDSGGRGRFSQVPRPAQQRRGLYLDHRPLA